MKHKIMRSVGEIALYLIFLQGLLYMMNKIIFLFVERTDYSDHMATMSSMIALIIISYMIFRKYDQPKTIFPVRFNCYYIIASIVTGVLLILTPSNYNGGITPIMNLLYSCVVVPVYEELLFREYIWNKLEKDLLNKWMTFTITTLLFSLWHIGYISSIAFRVESGLLSAMIWKMVTGLCYGIVLGLLRLKTKNSYSTMLLHSILNMFGR